MPYNCDVWFTVDFGEGPVRVRCTETGPHEVHTCGVLVLEDEKLLSVERDVQQVNHHNIFEADNNG